MNINPGKMLYENIFQNRDDIEIISIISDGCKIIYNNANRLIRDAKLLLNDNSYVSATFLGTTAREEMAKSHILIDACRLDFKHESTLRRLCKSFYNHIDKYAYYTVLNLRALYKMEHVLEAWKVNTKKYWFSEIESGEPDMPHEVNFLREMPLYVDYIKFDGDWFDPSAKRGKLIEEFRKFPIEDAEDEFNRYQKSIDAGLYSQRALEIIHDTYKYQYINMDIKSEELDLLYNNALNKIESEGIYSKIDDNDIFINALSLYYFANIHDI